MLQQNKSGIRESPGSGYQRPVISEDRDVLGQVKSNRMTEIKIGKKLRLWPWIILAIVISAYLIYVLWLKDQ